MILGDPYKFSIIISTIKEWNLDDTFCNGVLLFCINGDFFPKYIVTSSLKGEVFYLKEKLINLSIDIELYKMQKNKAFVEIYNKVFPEDTNNDNDYRFDITPESCSDNNCYIFAVSNGKQARIMAAKLDYIIEESRHDLKDINVSETSIPITELEEIISELNI